MLLWRKNVFYPIPRLQTCKCWTSSDVGAVSDLHQPSCREVLELYPTSLKTKDLAEGDGVVLLDGRRINLRSRTAPKSTCGRKSLPSKPTKVRVRDICRLPSACRTLPETPTSPQTNNFVHLCII
jgi:hypothetical protein